MPLFSGGRVKLLLMRRFGRIWLGHYNQITPFAKSAQSHRLSSSLTRLDRKTAKQFFDKIIKTTKSKFFNLDFVSGLSSNQIVLRKRIFYFTFFFARFVCEKYIRNMRSSVTLSFLSAAIATPLLI